MDRRDFLPLNRKKGEAIMVKADFYPVTDANKLLFLDNLVTAASTVGATVGLLPADITAITTARTNLRNAVNDKLATKTAAQGGRRDSYESFQ
jgi:hypothetical protein